MNKAEIIHKLNDLNFPVSIMPIDDVQVPDDKFKKIVRTDTDHFLGLVKSRYHPINHMNAFMGAIEAIEAGGVSLRNAEVTAKSYDYGALAKLEIIFPEHTELVGDHNLKLKFVARNSYNGVWKYQSFFGWMNEVCFNTLVSGQKIAYSSSRHTKHFDVGVANQKIKSAVKALTDEAQEFKKWWNVPVDDTKVVELYKQTLAKHDINEMKVLAGSQQTNTKQLGVLMDLYGKEVQHLHGKGDYGRNGAKGSLWAVYQSATAWSTHLSDVVVRENTSKHIIESKRQTAVKNMLNHKSWKSLADA